jgi:hypothetical protein
MLSNASHSSTLQVLITSCLAKSFNGESSFGASIIIGFGATFALGTDEVATSTVLVESIMTSSVGASAFAILKIKNPIMT